MAHRAGHLLIVLIPSFYSFAPFVLSILVSFSAFETVAADNAFSASQTATLPVAAARDLRYIAPAIRAAPILLVVPAQPRAPSVQFAGPSCRPVFVPLLPPPVLLPKPIPPHKSGRPCGACQVPQCGGQRKRYTPSKDKVAGSSQKIFTFCPATGKSTTSGFEDVVYQSFEHFKSVVDKELEKRK